MRKLYGILDPATNRIRDIQTSRKNLEDALPNGMEVVEVTSVDRSMEGRPLYYTRATKTVSVHWDLEASWARARKKRELRDFLVRKQAMETEPGVFAEELTEIQKEIIRRKTELTEVTSRR